MIALGELGLTYQYFYSLTPRTFINTINGFRKKENEQFKTSWEQVRELKLSIVQPYLDKKDSKLTAKEFMPFPWEEAINEKPKPTKEEVNETLKKWDKLKFKKTDKAPK